MASDLTKGGQASYGSPKDNRSTPIYSQNRSDTLHGTFSTESASNHANINNSGASASKSPLGSLRDLINQKLGMGHAGSHDSSKTPMINGTATGLNHGENPSNFSTQRNVPLANEVSGISRDTAMSDTRSTGNTTLANSLGGFSSATGAANSTMQLPERSRVESVPVSSHTNAGDKSFSAPSHTNMVEKPISSSHTNVGQKSRTAAGMGVGTGVGLVGTYDFLRTDSPEPNVTTDMGTSGPAHIAPPPGSREPPVTTSSPLRHG